MHLKSFKAEKSCGNSFKRTSSYPFLFTFNEDKGTIVVGGHADGGANESIICART